MGTSTQASLPPQQHTPATQFSVAIPHDPMRNRVIILDAPIEHGVRVFAQFDILELKNLCYGSPMDYAVIHRMLMDVKQTMDAFTKPAQDNPVTAAVIEDMIKSAVATNHVGATIVHKGALNAWIRNHGLEKRARRLLAATEGRTYRIGDRNVTFHDALERLINHVRRKCIEINLRRRKQHEECQ